MWDALVRYSSYEAGRSFLRPLQGGQAAASDFLRSDDTWTNLLPQVSGHQQTNATACPGMVVMNLLPQLRTAMDGGLAGTSRSGVTLTASNPGGRETVVNTPLTYTWAAQAPEPGWTVTGYEYCWEGWFKPSTSYDLQYLRGYSSDAQPRPVWTATSATTVTLTPTQAGHYTFHVRAVLQHQTTLAVRRSAYEGNHTYLVRAAPKGGKH